MTYIDAFVIPVPKARKQDYLSLAAIAAETFIDHGAVEVAEHWADDLASMGRNDFGSAVQGQAEQSIVLSWIIWPDKEARDRGMEKVKADPRSAQFGPDPMFNDKRMMSGGFERLLARAADTVKDEERSNVRHAG